MGWGEAVAELTARVEKLEAQVREYLSTPIPIEEPVSVFDPVPPEAQKPPKAKPKVKRAR